MIILDSLLIGGLRFVLDKIAVAADAEMNDEQSLREELLAAQMRLELGEMDEEELAFPEMTSGVPRIWRTCAPCLRRRPATIFKRPKDPFL